MAAPSLSCNGGRLAGRYRPMSEINVTPLVDVMLVLLVVFMVAAPLLTVGVPVDLPQTQAPPITEPKEPLVITINAEGHIYIQDTDIPSESLFATALGLVAAIPAVIAYNKLATDFGRYAGRLEAFASEFSAILSRQLDERP